MTTRSSVSVLTIAGSDSSGGAGIQADLKTFAAHNCYGTSAITALTAQNTIGVQDIFPSSPQFLEKQISSILSDINIKAIKTGMLYDAQITRAAVSGLTSHFTSSSSESKFPPLVCDPVCVSTSGHTLLDPDALDVMIEELFPLTTLVTPNKAETELLLSRKRKNDKPPETHSIDSLDDMILAAKELLSFTRSRAVLIKGGHLLVSVNDVHRVTANNPDIEVFRDGVISEADLEGETTNVEILKANMAPSQIGGLVVDVLCQASGKTAIFCRPRIESQNTHGTGCTLSAAIAARLGFGFDLTESVRHAVQYTHLAIERADSSIGFGHGPLNHFHSMQEVVLPKATPSNPYPLTSLFIQKTARKWKSYVEHDFVKLLGRGTLPKECFVKFMRQDYLYLRYYARAYALFAAKSPSFSAIHSATETILNILNELNTHRSLCCEFGVGEDELEETREEVETMAYGGYLIDVGLKADPTTLLIALLACLLGYGEVGLWLKKNVVRRNTTTDNDEIEVSVSGWVDLNPETNPYVRWIEDYSGERYQRAVRLGLETIETRAANDPPSAKRLEEWSEVWERCTELEKGFWDMAMRRSSAVGRMNIAEPPIGKTSSFPASSKKSVSCGHQQCINSEGMFEATIKY